MKTKFYTKYIPKSTGLKDDREMLTIKITRSGIRVEKADSQQTVAVLVWWFYRAHNKGESEYC